MNTNQTLALFALRELRDELNANGTVNMEVVDDLIDKVKFKLGDPPVHSYEWVMKMLHEGKKLKLKNLNYVYSSIPGIKVVGTDGTSDTFDLDCISTGTYDEYLVEKPINHVDSISVVSYTGGNAVPIEYIYANPQMNRLFAHLANGEDVDYDLNILDLSCVEGEYKGIPAISKDDARTISLKDLRDIITMTEFPEDKKPQLWEKVVEKSK